MAKLSRTKISDLIAQRTIKAGVSKKFDKEIAAYLLFEGRTNELNSLMRDVQVDWADHGQVEVTAVTAHPLTEAVRSDIKKEVKNVFPKAEKIIITPRIDPNVIGGLRLELPSQLLDLSVRAKLNKFNQLTVSRKD
jgi:F0F1-type ATP synthase delta subunit